jgi:hypothetical protein
MASVVYPKAKEAFLKGDLDLDLDVRIILIDTADYTYNAAHDFLSDVDAGARVATSGALTGKTFTNGVFDADDVVLSSVTGDASEAVIVYRHTGTESTSNLVAYVDSAASGLPVTPNGSNITIAFDTGANKIFAL